MASRDNTTRVVGSPGRVSVEGRPVVLWCRDTVSCLQATLATVLRHAGWDPLDALGPRFEFRFVPGDRPREEFYYPCGDAALGQRLFALHDVPLRWRAAGRDDGLDQLRAALGGGWLPIVTVDNYHLPFRPAYRDVHAAHLVVVCAVGDATVTVSDAMPPAFQGAITHEQFLAAWHADIPEDAEDAFFSGGRSMAGRWLDVRPPAAPAPATRDAVRGVMERNVEDFLTGHGTGDDAGGARGLARYRAELDAALGSRDSDGVLASVYTAGWPLQAQASLHAEWLRERARDHDDWQLAEVAAAVDRVCSAWTPVRVGAAHGRAAGLERRSALVEAAGRLERAYGEAVAEMQRLLAATGRSRRRGDGVPAGPARRQPRRKALA